ncbi:efflux RND transporter periplasmic adaptor subunit, partial [bacterium]|nr:efflux RND transporter periplasmic adaptor subunit [bacterium]
EDGIMGAKYAEEDFQVTPQDKVGSFVAYDKVYLETGIIERYVGRVLAGQTVRVKVDRWPNDNFFGVVESIAPRLEGASRTLTTKIRINSKEDLLVPGMFAQAEVIIFKRDDCLSADAEVLCRDENNKCFVYFVNENDIVVKKYVDVDYLNDKTVVLKSNELRAKDRIVLRPASNMQEGVKVRVKNV